MHVGHRQIARTVPLSCVLAITVLALLVLAPIGVRSEPALAAGGGSAGAVPIGRTRYPIPSSGAYFVSPTGSDAAVGSVGAPWLTLRHAVTAAPDGATIVMRAGVYQESVDVNGKRLTIQPYPREAVFLRGAKRITSSTLMVVNARKVWAFHWAYQFARERPQIVDPSYPLANAPDQLFANRRPLQQVATLSAIAFKTFYVDYPSATMYSTVNPATSVVEGSYLPYAIRFTNAAGSILRGIQVEMYATPLGSFSQLQVFSPDVTIENVVSAFSAASGVSVDANDVVLRHDTFTRNAQLGVHGFGADNLLADSVVVSLNNSEHFDVTLEGGGMKISTSVGSIVRDSLFNSNIGNGLWFDLSVSNVTVVDNTMRQNGNMGVQIELATTAVVARNFVWGNLGGGIVVTESGYVDVWNNTVADNGYDIFLGEWIRPQTLHDITVRNNVMYSSGLPLRLLLVNDYNQTTTAAQMRVTADGDAYCRVYPGYPTGEIAWADLPTIAIYHAVALFNSATNQEANGFTCDGTSADAWFVDASRHNWRVKGGTPLAAGGVPLAANVAAALGLPAGAQIGIGAG